LALPPHPAGLTPVDVGLVGVADLTHRGAAAHVHTADLARRHPQRGVVALPAEQLDADAGGAGQLGAAARTQLHRVDLRAHRDVAQRQVVARLDVRVRTRLDPVALLEVLRAEDVALLTVHVVEQRDAGGPVRVVLDVRDLGRHAVLVHPLEVDQPVLALVPTALVARGHSAVDVPAALVVQWAQQRLLRRRPGHLGEVSDAGAAPARRRWLVLANRHVLHPSADRSAEGIDPVALGELHRRPLRVLALAPAKAGALALALPVERVHAQHPYVEDLLDGDLDLGLVRVRVDQERVPVVLQLGVALLRDHRSQDHIAGVGNGAHFAPSSLAAGPEPRRQNSSSASRVNTTSSLTRTSYVFSWSAGSR